jgi:Holliday junction resolvasome RuvABC DNA-binding subunit
VRRASAEQLQAVAGIGPQLAERIVAALDGNAAGSGAAPGPDETLVTEVQG